MSTAIRALTVSGLAACALSAALLASHEVQQLPAGAPLVLSAPALEAIAGAPKALSLDGFFVETSQGRAPLPPKWLYSPWRWRDEHTQRTAYYDGTPVAGPFNSEVMEDVLMMQAFGIPNGVYWIDRPWGVGKPWGYDDFEIDPARLPNFREMVRWLDSRRSKTVLWITAAYNGKMATEALAKGLVYPGQTRPPNGNNYPMVDLTNPAARQYWQDGIAELLAFGVAGFKLDRGEENIPDDGPSKMFDGRSIREMRNPYISLAAKAAHDDFLIATWRLYARLHERLKDYSYAQAETATRTGMPIVRPLFLADPDAPQAWSQWWTYLYGPDLLVAPVWQKGQRTQEVYLPAGSVWRNAWGKEVVQGGRTVTVAAEPPQIPIFVRVGSTIDLGDLSREWADAQRIARERPNLEVLEGDVVSWFAAHATRRRK